MNKIKKGDDVVVILGKDRSRRGTVSTVLSNGKLLVDGINMVKKHVKANPNAGEAGGIIEKEMPIAVSNVMLWNPKTEKGDRVGFRFEGEGKDSKKVRYFKSNGEAVSN